MTNGRSFDLGSWTTTKSESINYTTQCVGLLYIRKIAIPPPPLDTLTIFWFSLLLPLPSLLHYCAQFLVTPPFTTHKRRGGYIIQRTKEHNNNKTIVIIKHPSQAQDKPEPKQASNLPSIHLTIHRPTNHRHERTICQRWKVIRGQYGNKVLLLRSLITRGQLVCRRVRHPP